MVPDGQVVDESLRDLFGAGRAARAAVLPVRIEHEVVDDQLGSALEHVDESRRTVRTVEDVVLLDLDHWQVPALDVERVTTPGHVLLFREQRLAQGQPLAAGSDLGKAHRSSSGGIRTWASGPLRS